MPESDSATSPAVPADHSAPLLAVVIVTHNARAWLPAFSDSWFRTVAHLAQPLEHRIIIADSASTDDTLAVAATCFNRPEVNVAPTLLTLPNRGYGSAANAAVAATFPAIPAAAPSAAAARWLLLCNPDLTFAESFAPAFLGPLATPIHGTPYPANAALVAPRIVNPDGSAQPSVGRFPTLRSLIDERCIKESAGHYLVPQPVAAGVVPWASGACLLIRRDAFFAVGGFDPGFFMYVEEVDLQRRLTDAGHVTWFNPAAVVTHHDPAFHRPPDAQTAHCVARSMQRYLAKHGSPLQLRFHALAYVASGLLPWSSLVATRATILARPSGP